MDLVTAVVDASLGGLWFNDSIIFAHSVPHSCGALLCGSHLTSLASLQGRFGNRREGECGHFALLGCDAASCGPFSC